MQDTTEATRGRWAWAYIGLGGNYGDTVGVFVKACQALNAHPEVQLMACASLLQSVALHPETHEVLQTEDIPRFCNTGILVRTGLTPQALLAQCLAIEGNLGRCRNTPMALVQTMTRPIDIDLWLYVSDKPSATESLPTWWQLEDPLCQVPHPHMTKRDFVLHPLHTLLQYHTYLAPESMPQDLPLTLREHVPHANTPFPMKDTLLQDSLWYNQKVSQTIAFETSQDFPSKACQKTAILLPYEDARWHKGFYHTQGTPPPVTSLVCP